MWQIDYLNNARQLAGISAKIYLYLKDIVEIHLISEHYFEAKEDGEPLIVSCHQIVSSGVYVKTREAS